MTGWAAVWGGRKRESAPRFGRRAAIRRRGCHWWLIIDNWRLLVAIIPPLRAAAEAVGGFGPAGAWAMQRYILIRLGQALLALWVVSLVVFGLGAGYRRPHRCAAAGGRHPRRAGRAAGAAGLRQAHLQPVSQLYAEQLSGRLRPVHQVAGLRCDGAGDAEVPGDAAAGAGGYRHRHRHCRAGGGAVGGEERHHLRLGGQGHRADRPVAAAVLVGAGADVDFRGAAGPGADFGAQRPYRLSAAGVVYRLVPGGGADAAGAVVDAGGDGQRVHQSGAHQGAAGVESHLEARPPQTPPLRR